MTKTYLLSTLIVLISIVLCACQFSTLSSSKKDTNKDKENIANIYAKKVLRIKKIGKCIKVILHMYFIIQ